jgi:Flp pilus assembly protein TadD
MGIMRSWFMLFALLALNAAAWSQQQSGQSLPPSSSSTENGSAPEGDSGKQSSTKQAHTPNLAPPRSDRVQADDLGSELGQSSSKDTQMDLNAPQDDDKAHPQSSAAVAEAEAEVLGGKGGITEFHTWDPHKAAKSIEVGNFYYKRGNYRAAEDRYREALRYKENDAAATIRLAVCLEKLGVLDDARSEYESYLKILPHGPESEQAQKAIDRLKAQAGIKPQ